MDEGKDPAGSPSGKELKTVFPSFTPASVSCQLQAEDKGPRSVAHTASLDKSKMGKGKEKTVGSNDKIAQRGRTFPFG